MTNSEKEDYGTASNHYFTALYEVAVRQGIDANTLVKTVGLSCSALHQEHVRIPNEKLAELQRHVWLQLNDETMQLAAQRIPCGSYFMMGQVSIHQPNLAKALKMGARFYNLLLQDELVRLQVHGQNAVFAITLTDPQLDYQHLFAEMCLLAWHRYASWLIAEKLPLIETQFPYPAPAHISEYHYLFPGAHRFSSEQLALVFPVTYLDKLVKQNSASLKTFMKRCPLELFRQYNADYSLTSELKILIKNSLQAGHANISQCAAQIHMTPRTLMRRLKQEGTSFQQLKDVIRRDRAIYLLSQKAVAITEVAERLGYSDPTVFTRAFRSWTGDSPQTFRKRLQMEQD